MSAERRALQEQIQHLRRDLAEPGPPAIVAAPVRTRSEKAQTSPQEKVTLFRGLSAAVSMSLATGRYVGESFDDSRLDTLVLALPVAWKGTVAEYAGRLHRRHLGKVEVRIHDYSDGNVAVLGRMLEKRLRAYRAVG